MLIVDNNFYGLLLLLPLNWYIRVDELRCVNFFHIRSDLFYLKQFIKIPENIYLKYF